MLALVQQLVLLGAPSVAPWSAAGAPPLLQLSIRATLGPHNRIFF